MADLNTLWKKGSGKPLIGDLVEGGLGIDTQGGKAYTKDASGSIVELGASTSATQNEANFAQHGLIPTDGVNEIRPQDMFMEVDVADTLVDKKGYPVSFTDGIYNRLGDELVTSELTQYGSGGGSVTYSNDTYTATNVTAYLGILLAIPSGYKIATFSYRLDSGSITYYTNGTTSVDITTVGSGTVTFLIEESYQSINIRFGVVGTTNATVSNISVKELPQFALPKSPFVQGSISETIDDKVNGLVTQSNHSTGDIVAVGSELVINGTFTTDVNNWSNVVDTVIAHDTNRIQLTRGSTFGLVYQPINLIDGLKYTITTDIVYGTGSAGKDVGIAIGNNASGTSADYEAYLTADGTLSLTFTALSTSNYLTLRGVISASDIVYYDNISVKLLDKSYVALEDTLAGELLNGGKFGVNPSKSTDELLDDSRFGVTCQNNHSKGDLVVSGNELVNPNVLTDLTLWFDETSEFTANGTFNKVTTNSIKNRTDATYNISNNAHIVTITVTAVSTTMEVQYRRTTDLVYVTVGTISAPGTYTFDLSGALGVTDSHPYVYYHSADGTFSISSISVKAKDDIHIATEDTANMYDRDTTSTSPNCSEGEVILNLRTDSGIQNHYYLCITDTGTPPSTVGFGASFIDLGTASSMSLQNPYFKAIPYATKQVALLVEKTSTGAILNTVKPLVNMYGEESVLTYEADIMSELGYSQVKGRVWTDDSSEFILLGLKGYLNIGSYEPFSNPFGCSLVRNIITPPYGSEWYATDNKIDSLYNSLLLYPLGKRHDGSGAIGQSSGRPDSKFYDKAYINGQGGLVCFSIPNAKTPTYKHQQEVKRNLVDGYIENGVEMLQVLQTGGSGSTYPNVEIAISNPKPIVGTSIWHNGEAHRIESVEDFTTDWRINLETVPTKIDMETIQYQAKSNYLVTSGSQTHTDLIADPANYPQDVKNITASGKGVGFLNALLVGQDGTDYIPSASIIKPIVSKKASYFPNEAISSVDNGITWAVSTIDNDVNLSYVDNTLREVAYGASNIFVVPYIAQNQPAVSIDTPQPIEAVDMDMLATNSHSVYAYNGLTYASSGKVATGAVVEAKGVDDVQSRNITYIYADYVGQSITMSVGDIVVVNHYNISVEKGIILERLTSGGTFISNETTTYNNQTYWKVVGYTDLGVPKHSTLTLDADSIVGSKALVTQTVNAIQVFTQEMIYNVDWGDTDEFDLLTQGTTTNLNGDTIQHKVLIKQSSIKLGE